MEFKDRLIEVFEQSDLTITETQVEQFLTYRDLILDWNEKINLTAILDDEGMATKHFLDSAIIINKTEFPHGASVVDIGAGAGFPSIPMKIMRPDLEMLMVDSLGKKVKVLHDMIYNLGLSGIDAVHSRAEDLGNDKAYRENFDFAVARAVTRMRELSEYTLPLVKKGGKLVALKSGEIEEELDEAKNAIKQIGGKTGDIIYYELLGGDKRSLVLVDKIKETPKKFPRPNAKIKKQPII